MSDTLDEAIRIRLSRIQQEALGYLELGMHEHALKTLDRLDGEGMSHPFSLYLRGESLRSLERHQEAIGPLAEAARHDPNIIEVWLAIGWCQKRIGRIDLAIEALKVASEVEPKNALIQFNLACYYSLSGQHSLMLDHLSQALTLDLDYLDMIADESDFDPVRDDPDFLAICCEAEERKNVS